jgi:hypothetical protein
MRAAGLCASFFAAAQLVIVAPAYAGRQDDPNAASADTKPAKPSKKATTKKTAKPKKPKKGDKKTETVDTTPPPAPPPADPPAATTTLSSATVPAADPTPPAPPPPPDPPKPAVEDKPAPTEVADGMVEVHIESSTSVRLQKRVGSSWEQVCSSPCDTKLGVTPQYRIAGIGLNDSEPFTLDASKGRVNLKVDPGTQSGQQRGLITLIGSGAVLAGGAAVIILAGRKGMDANNQLPQSSTNAILIGSSMMLAGVIGGIVGGSWYVQNAHTGVSGDVGRTTREKGEAKAATKKSAENDRQPTWNTPTMPAPAATTVPFLTGTF